MKLPRDLTGRELAKALAKLGYGIDRQVGTHIRLTTIPDHDPIKIGTLNSILREVGEHAKLDRRALLEVLFG